MASPSPTTTTRARSIQTLDGYVSRGRAPPSSVPRDHATLQDFAAFLELRLKSQNVYLLRRVFADFLNEQEHTLVPLMRQGVSIITVFPVLRTSPQRRRQAQRLLAKPKSHLDPRGCVFLYLQYRAATRNMALLKHIFLEFVGHKEASLLRFVERGNEVISVIPFELPHVVLPAPAPAPAAPAPAEAAPEQQLVESPRAVEAAVQQPVEAERKRRKTRSKERRKRAVAKPVAPKESAATSPVSTEKQQTAATQQEPPQGVETAAEQQSGESGVVKRKTRSKERKNVRPAEPKELATASAVSSEKQRAEVSSNPGANQGKRERRKKVETQDDAPATPAAATAPVATLQPDVTVAAEPERVQNKRRSRRLSAAAVASAVASTTTESAASEQDHQDNTGATASSGSGDADASQVKRGRRKKVEKKDNCVAAAAASVPVAIQQNVVTEAVDPERVVKRRSRRISDAAAAANTEPAINEGNQESSVPVAPSAAVESAPARGEKPKSSTASQEKAAATPVEAVVPQAAGTSVTVKALPATATPVEAPQDPPKAKRGRKRKAEADKQKDGSHTAVKSHKRGKPVMSEAMCRSQEQLTRKMEAFEAQIPWEAVFGNLPLPFEEEKHPELAKKLHRFWHRHSRAVWERKFWAPMSRKTNTFAFNKRNNRQISAKNAFETIILAAYEQLGAAFFVRLDMQQPRHPGWWYRCAVVALFAFQEVKGEDAVWDYVKNDALERFPDCKLPIPIKAPNYGAVQNCHKSASESMWMANHPLTPTWLGEIAALKAKQQAHGTSGEEAGVSQPSRGPDREPENVMTLMDALGFT